MKQIHLLPFMLFAILLAACRPATPLPTLAATTNAEFTLAPDQTAAITDTGLSIRLIAISSDQRCPSDLECAESGPVTLAISIQKDSNSSVEFILQVFTGNDGRAPEGPFEGIRDRVEYEGYLIRIKGVLPYPVQSVNESKSAKYRVAFFVTAK